MDSLMLMMQIEDEFGFEFTRQENFRTVEDVCRYIRENATRNL
jgi:acyl carrier protein